MTKHLRFLFIMLLAMIWSAGWAQEVTMNFTDNTSWNFSTDSKNKKSGTYGKGNCAVSLTGGNYYSSNKYLMLKDKGTLTFATFNFDVEKIVITGKKGASSSTKQNIYVGNVAVSSETIGSEATNTYLIKDGYQSAGNRYVLKVFDANAQITKIQIYKKGASSSTKTDTKVSFDENSGKTFTFTEGKYSNGTFTTPTATETNGVAGTVAYSSSNATAISVDASTGEFTFLGYGEATITATFTPTDTETYAVSTDWYKVVNKKEGEQVVTFVVNEDKGKTTDNKEADEILKENVTISSETAALGRGDTYRFYKNTTTGSFKVITSVGYITKIEFYGSDSNPLSVLSSLVGTYSYDGTKNIGTWTTDNSTTKEVVFKAASQARATKVIVTIQVPSGITLDESEDNTIEAKTGVNVTLKRTMVKGEWNTICLPFAVTMDKAKAAFGDNVKIVELDTKAAVDANVLSFKASTGIVAATPYLIKPSAVADKYTFENVDITNKAADYSTTANVDVAFKGIYNMVDITKDVVEFGATYYAAFLGADNKIYKAKTNGNKTKGFRAYFAIPKSASASALRVVIDGTATSIKNIDSEVVESNAPVYNLQGQRVDGNNLTPGIYVKAGKKFVVK